MHVTSTLAWVPVGGDIRADHSRSDEATQVVSMRSPLGQSKLPEDFQQIFDAPSAERLKSVADTEISDRSSEESASEMEQEIETPAAEDAQEEDEASVQHRQADQPVKVRQKQSSGELMLLTQFHAAKLPAPEDSVQQSTTNARLGDPIKALQAQRETSSVADMATKAATHEPHSNFSDEVSPQDVSDTKVSPATDEGVAPYGLQTASQQLGTNGETKSQRSTFTEENRLGAEGKLSGTSKAQSPAAARPEEGPSESAVPENSGPLREANLRSSPKSGASAPQGATVHNAIEQANRIGAATAPPEYKGDAIGSYDRVLRTSGEGTAGASEPLRPELTRLTPLQADEISQTLKASSPAAEVRVEMARARAAMDHPQVREAERGAAATPKVTLAPAVAMPGIADQLKETKAVSAPSALHVAESIETARTEFAVQHAAQPVAHHRAETPGVIARQLADAMPAAGGRPVDIALNPEELGRVRMALSTTDGSVTLHVMAERPETLDLMRRHIAELAQEFRSIGYGNINFSFAGGDTNERDGGQDQSSAGDPVANAPEVETLAQHPLSTAPEPGLDIRL